MLKISMTTPIFPKTKPIRSILIKRIVKRTSFSLNIDFLVIFMIYNI